MRWALPLVAARWITRCVTGDAVRLADGHGGSAEAEIVDDTGREGSGLYWPPKFGIRYADPYLHSERCKGKTSCKVSGTELRYRCACPHNNQVCAEDIDEPPERNIQPPIMQINEPRTGERSEPGIADRGSSFVILAGLTGTVFASVLVLASIGRVIQFSFREVGEKHDDVMAGVPDVVGNMSPSRRVLALHEDFAARVRALPKSPGRRGSRFRAIPPPLGAPLSAERGALSGRSSPKRSGRASPERVRIAPPRSRSAPAPPEGRPPLLRSAWGSARGSMMGSGSARDWARSAWGSARPPAAAYAFSGVRPAAAAPPGPPRASKSRSEGTGRASRRKSAPRPSAVFPLGDGAASPLVPQIAPKPRGRGSSLTRQPSNVVP